MGWFALRVRRVRQVRPGQIRAVCTRNARQEANLNKQHKQRTTPASFYDAAIRHSRFPSRFQIRHIIIALSHHRFLTVSGLFPRPSLTVCLCLCVCAPFMRQPQSQPQPADTASVFRTFHLLRSQHVSMMGIYVFPPIDRAIVRSLLVSVD